MPQKWDDTEVIPPNLFERGCRAAASYPLSPSRFTGGIKIPMWRSFSTDPS